MTNKITKDFIKNLFKTSNVIEITKIIPSPIKEKSIPFREITEGTSIMTPFTKAILEPLTVRSKRKMVEELEEDNKRIRKIETEQESDDPDYTYFENKEIGVFLEKWYCANYKCSCGSNFLKYIKPNMPIIDIRCSNESHNINTFGPKYYQIKSTENDKIYNGYKYFDLDKNYIHVGSRRYGEICHNITTMDTDEDKELLIGYICITYEKINDNNIKILSHKSFKLNPRSHSELYKEPQQKYYTYNSRYPDAIMIDFDITLFYIEKIESQIININQQFDEKIIYQAIPLSFYEKYIKYKLKYLELKNKI